MNLLTVWVIVAAITFIISLTAERYRVVPRERGVRQGMRSLVLGVYGLRRADYSAVGWRLVWVVRVMMVVLIVGIFYMFLRDATVGGTRRVQ
ncbi:MAG TPA: hypothetical protein VN717_04205 [Gemmatimonadaceae bacterium]|nr:hypothetical protein [Gemmatimonadaceae bacterium]